MSTWTQFAFPLMLLALLAAVGCDPSADNKAIEKNRATREAPAIDMGTSAQHSDEKVNGAKSSPEAAGNSDTASNAQHIEEKAQRLTSPDKLALLIGINEYASPEVAPLDGCVNDVEDMRSLLVGKFDFPEENIKVLTNEQATHEGVVSAFRSHLVENATSDSIVVFHYSGHGSQMEDTSGDETDGKDETIVTYDSRTEGVYDISDDEMNALFAELSQKTKNVTFILDSCHSGSGTRAAGGRSRRVEMDKRTPSDAKPSTLSGTRGSEEEGFENEHFVLISGCRSNEESKEYDADGQPRGTLTYFLTSEIRAAVTSGRAVTYRDIMDQVKAKVSAVHSSQHPQMEGANLDNFVFEDKTSLAQPYVLAQPIGDGEVALSGGKVLGFTAGSLFDIYEPGTKKFDGEAKRTAQIELTKVDAYKSKGKIVDGGMIEPGSRAIERQHSYEQSRFSVYLDFAGISTEDSVKDSEILQKIKQELLESDRYKNNFQLVDEQMRGRIVVSERNEHVHIAGNGSSIESPPVPRGDEDAVDRVLAQILHWAQWFNLLDLENPGAGLAVEFKIEGGRQPGADETQDLSRYFVDNDEITFFVENHSDKKLYFAIVDVCSDGSVATIYPESGDADPLGPGKTWSDTTQLFVNEGQEQSTDHMKLLVFDKQVDVSFLTSDATPRGSDDGCFPLANAMFKTRGARKIRRDSWTTKSQALRVKAAK